MTTKRCFNCNTDKDVSEFAKHAKRADGLQSMCKVCKRQYDSAYFTKNRTQVMERRKRPNSINLRLMRTYEVTLEELLSLRDKFDGKCWICKVNEGTCVDHCHDSLRVRGMLCKNCNAGIGLLGDTQERVKAALEYFELNPG